MVHIHSGILLSHEKNEIMPFAATWMDPEIITLSQSERERQIPYDITYNWNLIYSTNEVFYRKENHGLGKQTCGCPGVRGRAWEGSGAWG